MENVTLGNVLIVVLAIAGAIITLGGATAVVKRWVTNSPSMKNKESLNQLNKRVESVEAKTSVLESHQQENDEFTKIMCNSMLALLNHAITGSSVGKLQEAEEEIKKYLINK